MCIIIDINCLASVFERTSAKHSEFEPVLNWILSGKGKIILGGTKYIEELKKTPKYLKIIRLLGSSSKKVIVIDKNKVDEEQAKIELLIIDKDFDDPHLPAIVIVAKCMLICSDDSRSTKFVTKSEIYPNGVTVPKYYMGLRNINLLCDKYIDGKYKPLIKCNKAEKDLMNIVLNKKT